MTIVNKSANIATSRRLLSSIVNEKLVSCKIIEENIDQDFYYVKITPQKKEEEEEEEEEKEKDIELVTFYVNCHLPAHFIQKDTLLFFDPEDVLIQLPIMIQGAQVSHPCVIFDRIISCLHGVTDKVKNQLRNELESSVQVQGSLFFFFF